jgi:hypothetical protein
MLRASQGSISCCTQGGGAGGDAACQPGRLSPPAGTVPQQILDSGFWDDNHSPCDRAARNLLIDNIPTVLSQSTEIVTPPDMAADHSWVTGSLASRAHLWKLARVALSEPIHAMKWRYPGTENRLEAAMPKMRSSGSILCTMVPATMRAMGKVPWGNSAAQCTPNNFVRKAMSTLQQISAPEKR